MCNNQPTPQTPDKIIFCHKDHVVMLRALLHAKYILFLLSENCFVAPRQIQYTLCHIWYNTFIATAKQINHHPSAFVNFFNTIFHNMLPKWCWWFAPKSHHKVLRYNIQWIFKCNVMYCNMLKDCFHYMQSLIQAKPLRFIIAKCSLAVGLLKVNFTIYWPLVVELF